MSGSVSGEIRAEPNLTPLLDVVFQLITFFMLVINFGNADYDARVRLPVAASASSPEDSKVEVDRLTFNIDKRGYLLFNGEELDPERTRKEVQIQAELKKGELKRAKKPVDDATGLPTVIVIRCDRDTEYSQIYRLITLCQAEGFRRFSLKAMNAEG